MKRRRKPPTPIALLWTRRDQLRFISTVESLVTAVGDLTILVQRLQAEHARRPRARHPRPVIVNDNPSEGA